MDHIRLMGGCWCIIGQFNQVRDLAVVDAVIVGTVGFVRTELGDLDNAAFTQATDGSFDGGFAPASKLLPPLVYRVVDPFKTIVQRAELALTADVMQLLQKRGFDYAKLGGNRFEQDDGGTIS